VKLSALAIAVVLALPVPGAEPDRNVIALEALSRLTASDLKANPALQKALDKVLEANGGKPEFVKLVRQFNVAGQERGLILVAASLPAHEAGVDAARLLLDSKETPLVSAALAGGSVERATGLAAALGNTADKRAVPLLTPLVSDAKRDAALRKQAVRSLARTHEGAQEVVALARKDALSAEVKFTASTELHAVRWEDIKRQAAELLPLPTGRDARPLPPVAELLKRHGDPQRGEKVFFREETQCAKCHKVGDQGVDFGPALTEIGAKLGKDALYEAILDPSAGMSFDYEGWELTLRSGEEHAGIVVSESGDELALKNAQGVTLRLKKAAIERRQKMKLSLMPAGLQLTMSTDELVDLVHYLASLKPR
jgi:putative heme-binding domain-containing protein